MSESSRGDDPALLTTGQALHDYTRTEVVACLEKAKDLVEMAQFWASLEDHKHDEDDHWDGTCESELCLEAWRMYPDG